MLTRFIIFASVLTVMFYAYSTLLKALFEELR